jgi:predicted transcriptional regulator
MAIYRQTQTTFWQDDFILQLTTEEKFFYLYLLTNSKTKQCGIYQLPIPVMILETGFSQATIQKLLNRFEEYGKIIYSPVTKEIGLLNWHKYNPAESPRIKTCVNKELKDVKDKSMIEKMYTSPSPVTSDANKSIDKSDYSADIISDTSVQSPLQQPLLQT